MNEFKLAKWILDSIVNADGLKILNMNYSFKACVFNRDVDAEAWKELSQEKYPDKTFFVTYVNPYHLVVANQ